MLQRIGRYRVIRQIGAGGAASVYLARDEEAGRDVALKVLHPDLIRHHHQVARLRQEAEWISLLRHPNLVRIYEVGEADGLHYMAAEFIDGVSVRELMPPELPPVQALEIACGITDGLAAAHENWIIHRDIKPENVMLASSGGVKILDFGLAKLNRPGATAVPLTRPGMIVGTLTYLAPEQVMGQAADPRTDLFSVGVLLYEMLTGHPPFDASSNHDLLKEILYQAPPPLTPEPPAGLSAIVMKALQKDPDDRYQTAPELGADLRRSLAGLR